MGQFDDITTFAERADTIAVRSGHALSVSQEAIPRFLTAVAYTSTGTACSFMTFTPVYSSSIHSSENTEWGWTLDIMRRTSDTPPGVVELLLVHALERFHSQGATVLSLGLVAWSDTQNEILPLQRKLADFITGRLHLLETHDSLFRFKQKFHPRWESRYIVTRLSLSLPQVALGVLRVRNYSRGGKKLV